MRAGKTIIAVAVLLLTIFFMPSGHAAVPGDADGDGTLQLKDAITILQLATRMPAGPLNLSSDVNGDGRLGIAETIFILQKMAGLRVLPDYPLLTNAYVTAAAQAETFCTTGEFPTQWTWDPAGTTAAPAPAVSGEPLVKQIRNGQVIATYQILGSGACTNSENSYRNPVTACGPFSRSPFRNWADGDTFEVYPAVYAGLENQPWIGPMVDTGAEYDAGQFHIPKNITIRGITVNGQRPVIKLTADGIANNNLGQSAVYLDDCENITIENIDIDGSAALQVGKAAIFLEKAKNLILRDMRIHGFRTARANGIFGSYFNAGTLTLERIELYDNGGDGGPEHNIYINESEIDAAFQVHMRNSWSHDAFYGHTYKSRAQVNVLEGNYFQGGVPVMGETQAENYLVDIPNGGILVMRNNILVKNHSGDSSNGMSVTYGMEGITGERPCRILIENNTFLAMARYYDSQEHPLFPFSFFYPQLVPGSHGFPVNDAAVQRNVFAGYCNRGDPVMDYRGDIALTVGFSELNLDYSLKNKYGGAAAAILNTPAYRHAAQGGAVRTLPTIGAVD